MWSGRHPNASWLNVARHGCNNAWRLADCHLNLDGLGGCPASARRCPRTTGHAAPVYDSIGPRRTLAMAGRVRSRGTAGRWRCAAKATGADRGLHTPECNACSGSANQSLRQAVAPQRRFCQGLVLVPARGGRCPQLCMSPLQGPDRLAGHGSVRHAVGILPSIFRIHGQRVGPRIVVGQVAKWARPRPCSTVWRRGEPSCALVLQSEGLFFVSSGVVARHSPATFKRMAVKTDTRHCLASYGWLARVYQSASRSYNVDE